MYVQARTNNSEEIQEQEEHKSNNKYTLYNQLTILLLIINTTGRGNLRRF
jgi:hypothetical protein